MAVPTAYLSKADSAQKILGAMQRAGVPDKFSHDFLQKQLGFSSSSDRPIIPVLRALGFIDDSGVPTDRYRAYKDPAEAPRVIAEAMRSAYADVFASDQHADRLSVAKLQGIFARISGKGDSVTQKMASTFKAFADLGDFDAVPGQPADDIDEPPEPRPAARPNSEPRSQSIHGPTLHHDVHVHLPASTDIAVYDAIFRSLKEHLAS